MDVRFQGRKGAMVNSREFFGFLALIVLVYGVGQSQALQDGLHNIVFEMNLWYHRMLG
jgi:hypothetical protein